MVIEKSAISNVEIETEMELKSAHLAKVNRPYLRA